MMRIYLVFALICIAFKVNGYKIYQDRIPNGDSIPHPCKPNYIWHGVGHTSSYGGGERNPFGLDFYKHNKTWSRKLCESDSDGDGLTNGQELGDPNCEWSSGQIPKQQRGISHPGVCDPWGSNDCEEKNSWVRCHADEFICNATKEEGVKNITIQFPTTPVPAKETTYICMMVALPSDGEFHVIANEPVIDNQYVMHHMLLFGCEDSTSNSTPSVGTPYSCNMYAGTGCREIIAGWTLGQSGTCGSPLAGIRIGKGAYKYASLQMHWNNPEKRPNYTDSSGMKLYYTSKLRPNDAGVLTVGQTYLEIPPGKDKHEVTGTCHSNCSDLIMEDTVHILRGTNHMHYLGRAEKVTHYRNGIKLRDLTNEMEYSYDRPVYHGYETPIEFKKGDELVTTCTYKSKNRQMTTFFGEDTSAEMCFAFFVYYPKQNMNNRLCLSFKDVPMCKISRRNALKFPIIDGCFWPDVLNNISTSRTLKPYVTKVFASCRPFHCLAECIPVVKEVLKQPCFQGDIGDFIRYYLLRDESAYMLGFFSRLDSCKAEMKECQKCAEPTECPGSVGKAAISTIPHLTTSVMFAIVIFFSNI